MFRLDFLPWCKYEDVLTTPAALVHYYRTPWCDLLSLLKTQSKHGQQNGRYNNNTATVPSMCFLLLDTFYYEIGKINKTTKKKYRIKWIVLKGSVMFLSACGSNTFMLSHGTMEEFSSCHFSITDSSKNDNKCIYIFIFKYKSFKVMP